MKQHIACAAAGLFVSCQTVVLTICILVHDILSQLIPPSRMEIYSRFWLACFCLKCVCSNSGFDQSEATIYILATAVINTGFCFYLAVTHTTLALHAKRASSVYISFSSDITTKSEDDFNQKKTRHFFKVQIRINSSLAIWAKNKY